MTLEGWIQIAIFSVIIILITRPLGGYMTRVFNGERTFLSPVVRPVERAVYWCCGVDEKEEQHWLTYAVALLFFSTVGFVSLYALQRVQWFLPFNPQGQTAVAPDLAFNTSVSFVTNTNWQAYSGETTMSYLTQMAGLTVHNFVSAATGIAMAPIPRRRRSKERNRSSPKARSPHRRSSRNSAPMAAGSSTRTRRIRSRTRTR
jgi:K+-transporting ATPase ATPase A chain